MQSRYRHRVYTSITVLVTSVELYGYQLQFPRVKQRIPSIIHLPLIFCLRPLVRYKRCSGRAT